MAGEAHCSMDDDPPTDVSSASTDPRLVGRIEAKKEEFREEVERLSDGQTMLCVAGDFK